MSELNSIAASLAAGALPLYMARISTAKEAVTEEFKIKLRADLAHEAVRLHKVILTVLANS